MTTIKPLKPYLTSLDFLVQQKEGGRGRGKGQVKVFQEVQTKSTKTAEEKYASDIRNLHEAYQVQCLMLMLIARGGGQKGGQHEHKI